MPVSNVVEHECIWIESLSRGDVSAADLVFAPDCTISRASLSPFKGWPRGRRRLRAFWRCSTTCVLQKNGFGVGALL